MNFFNSFSLNHSGFERNPKSSKFELYARIPRLQMIAEYKINGNVLILPIKGNGASNLTLGEIQIGFNNAKKSFFA